MARGDARRARCIRAGDLREAIQRSTRCCRNAPKCLRRGAGMSALETDTIAVERHAKMYAASNTRALVYLVMPALLAVGGIYLSASALPWYAWLTGQLALALFFFQCFILLHET